MISLSTTWYQLYIVQWVWLTSNVCITCHAGFKCYSIYNYVKQFVMSLPVMSWEIGLV